MASLLSLIKHRNLPAFKRRLRQLTHSTHTIFNLSDYIFKENLVYFIISIEPPHSYEFLKCLLNFNNLLHVFDKPNEYQETPLSYACRHGNFQCAKLLIAHKANVNHSYEDPIIDHILTPLSNALAYLDDLSEKHREEYENADLSIIKDLLEAGADANFSLDIGLPSHHISPLLIALNMRNCWIIEMLLNHGAKLSYYRTIYYGYQFWNSLDVAIVASNNTDVEKIIIKRVREEDPDDLGIILDFESLIKAIESNIHEKIELILAFLLEIEDSPCNEQIDYIAELIMGYDHCNIRFLYEFLILFPNMKNSRIKNYYYLESYAMKKYGESETCKIIRNFDCKLFDLLTLHLHYSDIRELTVGYTATYFK